MDTQKFTPKQLLILFAVNVAASVVAGYILYHLTKSKTDTTMVSPTAIKPPTSTATAPTTTATEA